ncbi:uroporphyrin-III C-methyltransferase, partial [Mortierella sp. AD094]
MSNPYDSPPESPKSSEAVVSSTRATNTTFLSQYSPSNDSSRLQGEIKLIGAGPGDPDLLTLAAYKSITSWADIVLADKLVSKEILALISCPLFIANKNKGCQASGQHELFERAIQALKDGKRVVRLKQGDPFIFGRGGEELLFFRRLGYEPTIVPGLSSSISGPLLANIPLTHRGTASQFLVCTGTGSLGAIPEMPPYAAHRTTVFLMALHHLEALVQDLVRIGYPKELPVAIVERASAKDQRCINATVGTVVQIVKEVGKQAEEDILTRKEIDDVGDELGCDRFRLWHVLSEEKPEHWRYGTGYINKEMIKEHPIQSQLDTPDSNDDLSY